MGRSPCCDKAGLKKGPWTPEEDQKLIDYIEKHGPGNWRALPKNSGLQRCGKSCRLRWTNYLRPDIKRGRFSFEEEESIIQLHSVLGNKWSAIAAKLPGRTDNEIKNYWNTHIRKRLLRMGIDPVTHGPRLDLLDLPSIINSLQKSPLLNMSALLNLQTLLNPELLRLATSLASTQTVTQNNLPQNLLNNSIISNSLVQNQADQRMQFSHQIASQVQNLPTVNVPQRGTNLTEIPVNISNVKIEQNGFPMNDQVNAETSSDINWYGFDQGNMYPSTDYTPFTSQNSSQTAGSNSSSFSSLLSTPCSSPANPLDASLMYLNNSPSEDEIESFFSNLVNKLDSPSILNACSS